MIAKTLSPSMGFDTSEALTLAQYQFLKSQGFSWGCRYVPLAGQSASVGISASELFNALSVGLGVMFVQFARGNVQTSQQGLLDGKAAAEFVLKLGVPSATCLWCDLSITSSAQAAAGYANAWYQGTIDAGMSPTAAGVYMEPGVPLTADQRYQMIHMQRYWATAANDPARFVANRGCQLIQLRGSDKGEYSPEPGLLIDADVALLDFFESAPVAVFA